MTTRADLVATPRLLPPGRRLPAAGFTMMNWLTGESLHAPQDSHSVEQRRGVYVVRLASEGLRQQISHHASRGTVL